MARLEFSVTKERGVREEDISIAGKAILVDSLVVYVRGRANVDELFRLSLKSAGVLGPLNSLRLTVETLIKTNKELVYRDDLYRPLKNIISTEVEKILNSIKKCISIERLGDVEKKAEAIAKKPWIKESRITQKTSRIYAWGLYNKLVNEDAMLPHEAYYTTALIAKYIWKSVSLPDRDGLVGEIFREIHFSPEHQQAGIGILSYFSTVLRQKLPESNASISIRQERDKVTLTIKYQDGTEEKVSHLLQEYGLVVTGDISAEQFLEDPVQAIALRQKLQMAEMEVRHTRELLFLEKNYNEKRFISLESEVDFLKKQLADQLRDNSNERVVMLGLLDKVVGGGSDEQIKIIKKLVDGIVDRDRKIVDDCAGELFKENPTLLEKIQVFLLANSTGGVLGNSVYDWLKLVWPIFPK